MVLKKLIDKEDVEKASQDIDKARKDFIRGGGKVTADVKREEIKEEWEKIQLRIKNEDYRDWDKRRPSRKMVARSIWIPEQRRSEAKPIQPKINATADGL